MRLLLLLTMSLMLGPLVGCASLGESGTGGTGGTGGSHANVISVACTNNLNDEIAIMDWELTASPSPDPIDSSGFFNALLEGVAVFDEGFLTAGQLAVPGGVEEVNLIDISATVHVRSGANGDDVILTSKPIPYQCVVDKATCEPTNDLPSVPGRRGNSDCLPENELNPCARIVRVPRSDDCSPDGECAALGRTGPGSPCSDNGFCITEDLRFELERASGEYTADSQGDVLFGWADESTGATVQEGGPNDGTWILPEAVFENPVGLIGIRVGVGPVLVALQCAMGVDSQGPLGVNSQDLLSSPTPESELIAFPIEAP